MANNVNSDSYAQYEGFDTYAYKCIQYLMEHDEVIWKLLYYNDRDCWNKPDLTSDQKGALVYDGSDDTSKFRVFMDIGQPDVLVQEICIIRISPYTVYPDNRTFGTVCIQMEAYSHYKINTLSNYRTRVDMIIKRFLQVFNGNVVSDESGSIGRLFFDGIGSTKDVILNGSQLPYKGKWLILSTKNA